jgi:hypothetical protein
MACGIPEEVCSFGFLKSYCNPVIECRKVPQIVDIALLQLLNEEE